MTARQGHHPSCPHFHTRFPWRCDCRERAAVAQPVSRTLIIDDESERGAWGSALRDTPHVDRNLGRGA